jgi:hypothetical protein
MTKFTLGEQVILRKETPDKWFLFKASQHENLTENSLGIVVQTDGEDNLIEVLWGDGIYSWHHIDTIKNVDDITELLKTYLKLLIENLK